MTQQKTHKCNKCRGVRNVVLNCCEGCSTPIAQCHERKSQGRAVTECPNCKHNGPFITMEPKRFRCPKCRGVFEGPEFGFSDTRPDINAMKMERESKYRKRGGRPPR